MKYILILLSFTTLLFSEISVSMPSPWTTSRSGKLQFQLMADSVSVGQNITFSLMRSGSKGSVQITKQKVLITPSFNLEYTVSKPVGGSDFYYLKWVNSEGDERVILPIGYSPNNLLNSQSIEAVQGIVDDKSAYLQKYGLKVGDSRVAFAWSLDNLYIISEGPIFIGIDPGNLKSSFVPFSARFVSIDTENEVLFSRYSRHIAGSSIEYEYKPWSGDMVAESGDVTITTIPLYELGIKASKGRQVGLVLTSGSTRIPAQAIRTSPATWTNLQLK